MDFPRMLYRAGGSHQLESGAYSIRLVTADEFDAATAEGWHLDQYAAKAAAEAPPAPEPMTREQMEAAATARGIKFDGRTSDKKLAALLEG